VMTSERNKTFDYYLGIAILLVVLGHFSFPSIIEDKNYQYLHDLIYKFHMPLFFFLSGLTVSFSIDSKVYDWRFYRLKATKFLKPFIVIVLLYTMRSHFMGRPLNEITSDVLNIIIMPAKSKVKFLWFIQVLFIFYLITPLLRKVIEWKAELAVILVLVISQFSASYFFSIDLICENLLFFSLPIFIKHYDVHDILTSLKVNRLLRLVNMLILVAYFSNFSLPKVIHCSVLCFMVWSEVMRKEDYGDYNIFIEIGRRSYIIYLWNIPIINVMYVIWWKFIPDVHHYVFILCTTILCIILCVMGSNFSVKNINLKI